MNKWVLLLIFSMITADASCTTAESDKHARPRARYHATPALDSSALDSSADVPSVTEIEQALLALALTRRAETVRLPAVLPPPVPARPGSTRADQPPIVGKGSAFRCISAAQAAAAAEFRRRGTKSE